MASSSGNSSGCGSRDYQNSGSEEDLRLVMDQRKRKRMQSNRESARRSRMRKQKHLDDLIAQVGQLRKDNNQILTSINITTQHYMNIESENSVLRAQLLELTQRLDSLNDILHFINSSNGILDTTARHHVHDDFINNNPMDTNTMFLNQPIMASPDIFQYYWSESSSCGRYLVNSSPVSLFVFLYWCLFVCLLSRVQDEVVFVFFLKLYIMIPVSSLLVSCAIN